jgi:hypothetical protein
MARPERDVPATGARRGRARQPADGRLRVARDVNCPAGVRTSTSLFSLLTLAFFAPVAAGCVSNEYVIPPAELARLANAPPATRGQRVHVVQEIGSRRDDALPAPETFVVGPPPPPPQEPPLPVEQAEAQDGSDEEGEANVNVDIQLDGDGSGSGSSGARGARAGSAGGHGWRGGTSTAPTGSWHGSTPGTSAGAWRGTPPASGSGSSSASVGGGHGSGGHGLNLGGGGGGGGGGNVGDAAVLLAVVVVVVAAVVVVGLAGSEGARFDGVVDMSPEQPVHLKPNGGGSERVLPLAAITPTDAATTLEAKVMDDEGYGIRRDQQILDRKGWTMKLDFGSVTFEEATSTTGRSGPVGHVQVGYFFTPSVGLLATAALGGAGDGVAAILTRHEFGLELQALPLKLGPMHAGGYVNGGLAMAATTANGGAAEEGTAAGAGALVELDLTGRLALTFRAGGDLARFADGWSPAATLSGGLAVY